MTWRRAPSRFLYWLAARTASHYIAGARVEDAVRVCARAASRGWATTICPWDRAGTPPQEVFEAYQRALQTIIEQHIDCYLSIKVPSLAYNGALVRELLRMGRRQNIRIHFDSHGPETATPTFAIVEELRQSFSNIGVTLPSRWRRSLQDAEMVREWGIPVRIVKGQWADNPEDDRDPNEAYLELINKFAGGNCLVAVATHHRELAARAIDLLKRANTPVEFEQLYGLPLRAVDRAAAQGVKVRVYIPYDYGYLPYALNKIRAQPIILWWLLCGFAAETFKHALKFPAKKAACSRLPC